MKNTMKIVFVVLLSVCAHTLLAQQADPQNAGKGVEYTVKNTVGPVATDKYRIVYIRLGSSDVALLYEPVTPGPNSRIALIHAHPGGGAVGGSNTFDMPAPPEMAKRGYRVLTLNHLGLDPTIESFGQPLSRGIAYLHTLPGVQRVVIVGHSGGGHLVAWYQNIAEHGPAACQGPEKIYPCNGKSLNGLQKADGVIILDSTLGDAFHDMTALDPAVEGDSSKRIPALDMFTAANGYDMTAKRAKYSADFAKRFYAAESARNTRLVDDAIARLNAIKQGKGQFSDDEPFVIRGMGVGSAGGSRLYQADTAFLAHTKKPHTLLKADGTQAEVIVRSVRPPLQQQAATELNSLHVMSHDLTVRDFLEHFAIRTKPDFAITEDDIVGVDWESAVNSAPGNAEGITVPTLVQANSCHYLMVQDEVIFDHLAAKDKTLAFVEGASHEFMPCRPEYGDTVKRAFDNIDKWLSKPGRF